MSDYRQAIIDNLIEIEPMGKDDFLKLKETLTRIGIQSMKNGEKVLWQSCHVLHKQGRYFIVHFKQLFLLDGRSEKTVFTEEDLERTRLIASLLSNWGLVKLKTKLPKTEERNIRLTIIPYKEKRNWNLRTKYSIGGEKVYE